MYGIAQEPMTCHHLLNHQVGWSSKYYVDHVDHSIPFSLVIFSIYWKYNGFVHSFPTSECVCVCVWTLVCKSSGLLVCFFECLVDHKHWQRWWHTTQPLAGGGMDPAIERILVGWPKITSAANCSKVPRVNWQPWGHSLLMFQTRRASLWPGWSWYHARFCSVTPLLTQVDLPEQYRNPTTKQLFPLFCYNFNHDSPGKYGKKPILITLCESHSGLKLKP